MLNVCIYMNKGKCMDAYVKVYAYIHIHIYIHMYVYIHMSVYIDT